MANYFEPADLKVMDEVRNVVTRDLGNGRTEVS